MPELGDEGLLHQIVSEFAQQQQQHQQQQQQQQQQNASLNDPSKSSASNVAANKPPHQEEVTSSPSEPMDIDREPQQQQQLQHEQINDALRQEPTLLATLVSAIPTVGSLAPATTSSTIPTVGPTPGAKSSSSSLSIVSTTSSIDSPSITSVGTSKGTDVKPEAGGASTTAAATSSEAAAAPTRSYSGKPFHPDDIFCLGCCRNLSIDHYTCPNTGRIFKSCHACRRKSRLNSKKAVKQKTVPVKESIPVDEFCRRLKELEATQSQDTQTLDVMVFLDGPTDMDVESLKARGSRIATYVYESTGYWFSHSRTNEETQSKTRLKIYGCSQRQDRKAPPAPKNHTKKRNRQSTKVYFDCKGSLTMTFHEGMNQVRVMYSHKSHAKYDNRKCPDHIRQYIKDNLNMMPKDIHDELKKREPDLTVTQAQVRYWSHYFKKNLDQDGDGLSDGASSGSSSIVAAGNTGSGSAESSGPRKASKTSATSTPSGPAATVTATASTPTSEVDSSAVTVSTVAMMGLGSSEHDAHSQLQRLAAQTQAENGGGVSDVVRDLTPPQATALLLSANGGGLSHAAATSPHHGHHHHHVEQLVTGPLTLPTSLASSDVVATIPPGVFGATDVKELHSHLLNATMAAVAQQHSGESRPSATSTGTTAAHDSDVVEEVNAILKETDVEQRIQQMLEEQQRQEQERAARQA